METMTKMKNYNNYKLIIAQLRRDGNYDEESIASLMQSDHSTTKTGWKL